MGATQEPGQVLGAGERPRARWGERRAMGTGTEGQQRSGSGTVSGKKDPLPSSTCFASEWGRASEPAPTGIILECSP